MITSYDYIDEPADALSILIYLAYTETWPSDHQLSTPCPPILVRAVKGKVQTWTSMVLRILKKRATFLDTTCAKYFARLPKHNNYAHVILGLWLCKRHQIFTGGNKISQGREVLNNIMTQ